MEASRRKVAPSGVVHLRCRASNAKELVGSRGQVCQRCAPYPHTSSQLIPQALVSLHAVRQGKRRRAEDRYGGALEAEQVSDFLANLSGATSTQGEVLQRKPHRHPRRGRSFLHMASLLHLASSCSSSICHALQGVRSLQRFSQ